MHLVEHPIFKNSVWMLECQFDLDVFIKLVKDLEYNKIFVSRNIGSGFKTPNFVDLKHEELSNFFNLTSTAVNSLANELGIRRQLNPVNYWFNMDKKNDYGNVHCHPEGIISGVFYIQCPQNSGRIYFERPDAQQHYFVADVDNEHNYAYYMIDPMPNTIILFPSYLKHGIEQNNSEDKDDKRISLSFNYR